MSRWLVCPQIWNDSPSLSCLIRHDLNDPRLIGSDTLIINIKEHAACVILPYACIPSMCIIIISLSISHFIIFQIQPNFPLLLFTAAFWASSIISQRYYGRASKHLHHTPKMFIWLIVCQSVCQSSTISVRHRLHHIEQAGLWSSLNSLLHLSYSACSSRDLFDYGFLLKSLFPFPSQSFGVHRYSTRVCVHQWCQWENTSILTIFQWRQNSKTWFLGANVTNTSDKYSPPSPQYVTKLIQIAIEIDDQVYRYTGTLVHTTTLALIV